MRLSEFRRRLLLCAALVSVFAFALGAQGLSAVAGSWQGDKALGTVFIREDGRGEITFEANSELRMAVTVSAQGGQYVVAQAEPNKPAFYEAFGLPPAAAAKMSQAARPMRWIFALSADRARLAGKKETTSYKRSESGDVSDIKNDYVRDSSWSRLTGKVAAPDVNLGSGSYSTRQTLVLSCATPGATIRYALNGATLSETSGLVYSSPIPVSSSTSLAAVAVREGWQVSDVLKAQYTLSAPELSMKAKWNDFDVELVRCSREGSEVTVEVRATNRKELGRWFGLCRWKTRAFGDDGNLYERTEAFFAGSSAGMGTVAEGELPGGIPVKLAMKFFDVPPSVKSLKLLELQVNSKDPDMILPFKDVPISE